MIDEALRSVERRMDESGPRGSERPARRWKPPALRSPTAAASASDAEAPAPGAELEELGRAARKELESLRAQLEFSQAKGRETDGEVKDEHERMLRAAADLENYKKRAQKEKEEVQKFGIEKLLKDLLPVIDNLDRALEHAQQPPDFDSLEKGVAMTRKLFEDTLGQHGVKGFSAEGQPFDPRLHEAMQQVETADVPAEPRRLRRCCAATRSTTGWCARRWSWSPRRRRPPAPAAERRGSRAGSSRGQRRSRRASRRTLRGESVASWARSSASIWARPTPASP